MVGRRVCELTNSQIAGYGLMNYEGVE